jgi:beta-N-acetylhexosaminidase
MRERIFCDDADRDDLGLRFLIGLRPTTALDDADRDLLRELRPCGVVVFKRNFDHVASYAEAVRQFARLLAEVRTAIGRKRIIVAVDHEGGRVFRLPPSFTNVGAARAWRSCPRTVGHIFGRELASMGINTNFSPVLDVSSIPECPAIGDRALSGDAAEVAAAAIQFVTSQWQSGVISCGKHFPGHGAANADSHYELPSVASTRASLLERDVLPFKQAIRAGLPMIMSAHLKVPAFDDRPTTVSRNVGRVLRGSLRFRGVYVTDDLGMRAVQDHLEEPEFAVDVARASHDLFMVCSAWTSTERVLVFRQHLLSALKAGSIRESEWRASRRRIENLLSMVRNTEPYLIDDAVFEHHRHLMRVTRAAGT